MRVRLRHAWEPEVLARMYAAPHQHARWPDHRLRVQRTIELGRELTAALGDPESIADLSCGDAAIARALAALHVATVGRLILGDLAPGYEFTGPIEQTISQVGHVGLFICCETAEHLDDPDMVLAEIRKRASWLLFSTPLAETGDANPEHYWGWDHDGVRDLFSGAGWAELIQRDVVYNYGDVRGTWPYQLWACR